MDKVELESIGLSGWGTPVESHPKDGYPEITPKNIRKSTQKFCKVRDRAQDGSPT
jgi:hypothetical protein